jgi:predicted Zn finger-like uncharacterized protein
MNIACESCGTRYTIPDKRAHGSVFKLRCEECGDVIVVRPDEGDGTAESATSVEDVDYAAKWYVVVDDKQLGPVTAEEIEQRFSEGQISGSSFVWRDGFSDWRELADVEAFSFLPTDEVGPQDETIISDSPATPDPAGEEQEETVVLPPEDFHRQAVDSDAERDDEDTTKDVRETDEVSDSGEHLDATKKVDGSDVENVATTEGEEFAEEAKTVEEKTLEDGDFEELDFEDFSDAEQTVESGAGVKRESDLVDQRSEDSVLFSLNNLEELEDEEGSDRSRDGEKGSGLIDLEALSSAHTDAESEKGDPDEPFVAESIQFPESGGRSSDTNRLLLWGIGAVVVLMLGGMGALAWIVVKRTNRPARPASGNQNVASNQQSGTDKETGVGEETLEATRTSAEDLAVALASHEAIERLSARTSPGADQETSQQKQAATPGESGRVANEGGRRNGRKQQPDRPAGEGNQRPTKNAPEPTKTANKQKNGADERADKKRKTAQQANPGQKSPTPQKKPEESRPATQQQKQQKKDSSEVDQILNQIGSKKSGGKGGESGAATGGSEEPEKDLPEGLTRQMVSSTIQKYRGRVEACGRSSNRNDLSGVIFIGLNIKASGAVSSTQIKTAKFRGTDVGECVENVVQGIEFPETQSSLSVSRYPFKIN